MGSPRLLWPVWPVPARRAVTDQGADLLWPVSWAYVLERAKGIEPS